jgi:alkylresorcinol/alkylpyrone synthase
MSAPRIASVELAMPPHEHTQEEIIEELSRFGGAVFTRFARTAGVTKRHLSLPLKEYGRLKDFTEANSRWI